MLLASIYLVVILGLVILEAFLVADELFGRATLLLLGTALAIQFLHVLPLWQFVSQHVTLTFAYVGAYLAAGVIWSVIKWILFLRDFRDAYAELRAGFLSKHPEYLQADGSITTEGCSKMLTMIGYQYSEVPRASNNMGRLLAWACYWVPSLLGLVFNDLIRWVFNSLLSLLRGAYQKIANKMFAKYPEMK